MTLNKIATRTERGAARRKTNALITAKWYVSNREREIKKRRAWRLANPNSRHARAAKSYGLSKEIYSKAITLPCAICGGKAKNGIDHDHKTGRIRGTLCFRCNLMIAHALDNPSVLRAGALYLESGAVR